jgi:subtilisin family serine protease
MNPLELINVQSLMDISSGSKDISIGIIDGPVDLNHPDLKEFNIKTVNDSQQRLCKQPIDGSFLHGTFIVGILTGKRGSKTAAICPKCKIILCPIFKYTNKNKNHHNNNYYNNFLGTTPKELADAIVEVVDAGAKIINLSLQVSSSSIVKYSELKEAYNYALQKEVIIVAAAGNQAIMGYSSIIDHPWLIPVVSCDSAGNLDWSSNISPSIAKRGLMAPGVNITSTVPGGQYGEISGGTSIATAFVTGAIALLWSIFPKTRVSDLISSVITPSIPMPRSIVPKLLNTHISYAILGKIFL